MVGLVGALNTYLPRLNTTHKLSLNHSKVDTIVIWTGFCCSAMYQSKSSLEVAVEAAARVDAVLAKKGRIKPNPIATAVSLKYQNQIYVASEFEVNINIKACV